MTPALRSEFRKLLTVRTTYCISLAGILIISFVSFWIMGYKDNGAAGSHFLSDNVYSITPVMSLFAAIIAILLMGHEYRYNLLVYSLTASRGRSKILAAKIITVLIMTAVLTAIGVALNYFLPILGHNLAGHHLPHQNFNFAEAYGKLLFYCAGFALAGLLFATLIRNLIFAIVFMLIVPNTIETLLTLLLKQKAVYLPFSSLSQVISTSSSSQAQNSGPLQVGHLSPLRAMAVFGAYIIVGWIITWLIFLRRDAN